MDDDMAFLNHPFFVDTAEIDPNQPLTPELEAIQALKYESENPIENARSYKEEGNHWFKKKDYKKSIVSYTVGIQLNCGDSEMQAALFLNRATCQFHLGNYRKCIVDASEALKLNPLYAKAHLRIAESLSQLHKYTELIERCEASLRALSGVSDEATSKSKAKADSETRIVTRKLDELKATGTKRLEAQHAVSSERTAAQSALRAEHDRLLVELRKRGVRVSSEIESGRVLLVAQRTDAAAQNDARNEPDASNWFYSAQSDKVGRAQIELDATRGELRWPIVVLYPQYRQSDMLTDVYDSDLVASVLRTVLPETRADANFPEWDTEREYSADHVETWFEHERSGRLVRVDPSRSILQVAADNRFLLPRFGVVRLIVLLDRRESQFSRDYIEKSGVFSE